MSFIRPQVRATLMRWRETLVGGMAAALGLWWAITGYGAVQIVGTALAVGGTLLGLAGIQRARFRPSTLGPGLVRVLEGQVTYFGPHDGGAVFANDITGLDLRNPGTDGASWLIRHSGGPPLAVPTDAAGAEDLFDVFSNLPGLDTRHLLAILDSPPPGPTVIWRRDAPRLH